MGLRNARKIRLPCGLLYDTPGDIDLAYLYTLFEVFDIRPLKNDVMTALVLQHHVAETLVDEKAVNLVGEIIDITNAYVKFAIVTLVGQVVLFRRITPQEAPRYESRVKPEIRRLCARYGKAIAVGGFIRSAANEACEFHEHVDDAEALDCREDEMRLGLSVVLPINNGDDVILT